MIRVRFPMSEQFDITRGAVRAAGARSMYRACIRAVARGSVPRSERHYELSTEQPLCSIKRSRSPPPPLMENEEPTERKGLRGRARVAIDFSRFKFKRERNGE